MLLFLLPFHMSTLIADMRQYFLSFSDSSVGSGCPEEAEGRQGAGKLVWTFQEWRILHDQIQITPYIYFKACSHGK
jgi:hypothetical protein